MENLDQFIEYLFTIEETTSTLTKSQFDKLKVIQGKVNDIVDKIQNVSQAQVATPAAPVTAQVEIPAMELAVAESSVFRFSEFQEVNETLKKKKGIDARK